MANFWNFKAKGDKAELMLYGEISDTSWWGDEVTPKAFKAELDALGNVDQIDIYINSGGGDVFAGEAIYNMLRRHNARKVVYVDGLAASIASIIAMVGDEIIMPENAMMMIHEAWTIAGGNKRDLRGMADTLERLDGALCGIYVARTGNTDEEIMHMMESETWMTASEAVAAGFADKLEANKKIAASVDGKMLTMNGQHFNMSRYANAPEITPCNGAYQQPVEEIKSDSSETIPNNALEEQRKSFAKTREKIMETYEKGD